MAGNVQTVELQVAFFLGMVAKKSVGRRSIVMAMVGI